MPQFMLLFRSEQANFYALPETSYEQLVSEFEQWYLSLQEAGKFVGKGRLKDGEGKTLQHREGRRVVDGPFSETKEALAGYFTVVAESYEDAMAMASRCPLLPRGASVEVRELHNVGEFTCRLT